MKPEETNLIANEAIDYCALRFDGYRYIDEAHERGWLPTEIDFVELNEPIIATGKLYDDDLKNAAVFFALQRSLGKWGGEQLGEDDPTRFAFYRLYLHFYTKDTPKEFVSPKWLRMWEDTPAEVKERVAQSIKLKVQRLPTYA